MYEYIFYCSSCQTKVAVQEPDLGGSSHCPTCGIELFFPNQERALKRGFERRICSNLEELELAVEASREQLSSRKAADQATRTLKAQRVSRLDIQALMLPRHAQGCRHTLQKGSCLIPALALCGTAFLCGTVALPFLSHPGAPVWLLLLLALALFAAGSIFALVFWYRFLTFLQLHPKPAMSPVLEAGLILIPGVNLFLIVRFWWTVAGRYRDIVDEQELQAQAPHLDQSLCRLFFIPGLSLVPLFQMHQILNWAKVRV